MTDTVTIEESLRRGALVAVVLATVLGGAGCSAVPDAVNPVEWYRGTRNWIAGDDKIEPAAPAKVKPIPGADKPFPELDSVPERPVATSAAARGEMARALTADRAAARYTDRQIRRQTNKVAASPLPPPSAPSEPPPPAATPQEPASAPPPPPKLTPVPQPQPAPPPEARAPPPARASLQSFRVLPPEVRNAEPAAGQVAALPPEPRRREASAPPPPPDFISAAQPVPVTPTPPRPMSSVPPVPPAAVEVAPGGERSPFVRPDPYSTRYPSGRSAAPGRQSFNAPPPVPRRGLSPTVEPGPGAVPGGPPVATVYFGSGSAKIGPRGREAIRKAFRLWKSRGGRIRVVGHASSRTRNMDRVSHELANFRISDERARAVAAELIRLGVDPTLIIVQAVSDHQPAFIEAMPAGEAGNRRAEILLEN